MHRPRLGILPEIFAASDRICEKRTAPETAAFRRIRKKRLVRRRLRLQCLEPERRGRHHFPASAENHPFEPSVFHSQKLDGVRFPLQHDQQRNVGELGASEQHQPVLRHLPGKIIQRSRFTGGQHIAVVARILQFGNPDVPLFHFRDNAAGSQGIGIGRAAAPPADGKGIDLRFALSFIVVLPQGIGPGIRFPVTRVSAEKHLVDDAEPRHGAVEQAVALEESEAARRVFPSQSGTVSRMRDFRTLRIRFVFRRAPLHSPPDNGRRRRSRNQTHAEIFDPVFPRNDLRRHRVDPRMQPERHSAPASPFPDIEAVLKRGVRSVDAYDARLPWSPFAAVVPEQYEIPLPAFEFAKQPDPASGF